MDCASFVGSAYFSQTFQCGWFKGQVYLNFFRVCDIQLFKLVKYEGEINIQGGLPNLITVDFSRNEWLFNESVRFADLVMGADLVDCGELHIYGFYKAEIIPESMKSNNKVYKYRCDMRAVKRLLAKWRALYGVYS